MKYGITLEVYMVKEENKQHFKRMFSNMAYEDLVADDDDLRDDEKGWYGFLVGDDTEFVSDCGDIYAGKWSNGQLFWMEHNYGGSVDVVMYDGQLERFDNEQEFFSSLVRLE